jgi:spermidine synthase
VKPWKTIGRAATAEGASLTLQERDGVFAIRVGGHELMSSARHGSEEALAQAALRGPLSARPKVLIGGLGMGYTLRAALDQLPPSARVEVAEISLAVIEWNRGPLAHLAAAPLADPRSWVRCEDVGAVIRAEQEGYQAIMLDVDNGPQALSRPDNQRLYGPAGLAAARRALCPGGVLAVWSASPAPRFEEAVREAGFGVRTEAVGARASGRARHVLVLARAPGSPRD